MRNYKVLLLLLLTLSACQTTSFKVGNLDVGKLVNQGVKIFDANSIDEAQEVQLGKNMSAVLLGARPLLQNDRLNHYINQVGMWLALNSSRADLTWHFGIINSSSINAFAAPGGYVFITSAMLAELENEAQLAAVLAHEIIHVIEQHHLEALKSGTLRAAITESLFVSAEAYQDNTKANSEQKNYRQWSEQISHAAQNLYSKGLDRDDELEADKLGMRLLAKAGYDPFAAVENIQHLQSIAADDSSLALLYKTHPSTDERLNALYPEVINLGNVSGLTLVSRFKANIH